MWDRAALAPISYERKAQEAAASVDMRTMVLDRVVLIIRDQEAVNDASRRYAP
jgi:hypothetical protein